MKDEVYIERIIQVHNKYIL